MTRLLIDRIAELQPDIVLIIEKNDYVEYSGNAKMILDIPEYNYLLNKQIIAEQVDDDDTLFIKIKE